jgi:hypothetical protein
MLLVTGAAVGCAGGSDPTADHVGTAPRSTPRSSTPPTASPAPMSPTRRSKAAVSVVRRLYAEYNVMLFSGSSKDFRTTFTSACRVCVANADQIDSYTRAHQKVSGGTCTISGLHVTHNRAKQVVVEGTLYATSVTIKEHGRVVDRYSGADPFKVLWRVSIEHGKALVTSIEDAK